MHRQAREAAKERLRERIERLCAKENNGDLEGCRVTGIRIVEGQPAEVVLQEATAAGADVIVMGSHRHTVIGGAVVGSTTHRVLHGASIPVLVVRIPEGFREEGF
jgi:nucleotide-binding universal stress UspA family protein